MGGSGIKTCAMKQNVYTKHWWWITCKYFFKLKEVLSKIHKKKIALKSKFQNKVIIWQQSPKPKKVLQ